MADLTITSPTDWAHELERQLGVPVSAANTAVLDAWAQIEGGHWHNTAYGNVLGTTTREYRLPSGATTFGFTKPPGATQVSSPINSVGVQRYDSWRAGIAATVSMLSQGNMKGIVDSLRANNAPEVTAGAIGDSPWLSGHTGNPAYAAKIDSALGRPYTPGPTSSTPAPGNANEAGLSLPTLPFINPLDPFGLGGKLTGGAADLASGITAPLLKFIDAFAIRALLVVAGVIAIIIGISGLFENTSSGDHDSGSESSSTSPAAPKPHRAEHAAEGAAEAL